MHFRLDERTMTAEEQERFWSAVSLSNKMHGLHALVVDGIWARLPNESVDDRGVPTQELVDYLTDAINKAKEGWPVKDGH